MLEQNRGDAAPLVLVVDGERDLRVATARPLVVARDADEVVTEQRNEGHSVVVVDGGEPPDVVLAQPRPRAEEPVVHALMRQATVEHDQSVGVIGTHRADMHRAAVAEHDIGFPLRRVAALDRRRLGAHGSERTERRDPRSGRLSRAIRRRRRRCAPPCRARPVASCPTTVRGSRATARCRRRARTHRS